MVVQNKKPTKLTITQYFLLIAIVVIAALVFPQFRKPSPDLLKAPGRSFQSSKNVEDYFVEKLRMSPEEAINTRSPSKGNDGNVSLRLSDNTTLEALVSNLHTYGFIRDEKAFLYALKNTKDTIPGKTNAIKVGKTGTIDVGSYYKISEDMDAWQLADVLLNKPTYLAFDEYGYMFMP